MKIPNITVILSRRPVSLARIVSEDSQLGVAVWACGFKSSKDS